MNRQRQRPFRLALVFSQYDHPTRPLNANWAQAVLSCFDYVDVYADRFVRLKAGNILRSMSVMLLLCRKMSRSQAYRRRPFCLDSNADLAGI